MNSNMADEPSAIDDTSTSASDAEAETAETVRADPALTTPIAKPAGDFSLDKFKSKRSGKKANVETRPAPMSISRLSHVKDFVRLHENEDEYWTSELCFVSVPIPGAKDAQLHLIDEDIAMNTRGLSAAIIERFRLALACTPDGVLFFARVPTQNLDNSWNITNLRACERAKTEWVRVTSRRHEGADGYDSEGAINADAFLPPKWPEATLDELIVLTFGPDRMITHDRHPGLLRLIGAKQTS